MSKPIFHVTILDTGWPMPTTLDPSLQPLANLMRSALYLLDVRQTFYHLFKLVQDSPDPHANKQWRGNVEGYIIKKDGITILCDYPIPCEEVLIVPIPLFLQALHEWEKYLQENFPKFTSDLPK